MRLDLLQVGLQYRGPFNLLVIEEAIRRYRLPQPRKA